MKYLFFSLFLIVSNLLAFKNPVEAKIGVGVGTGKIVIDEALKPGMIYELPSVTVLNTGDETGPYKLYITYHEAQPEKRPPRDWFTFTPEEFNLTPGTGEAVKINLTIPIKTPPGNYFAYIEAQPKQTSGQGTTQIGIAAATKLYFTVKPANFIQGLWYRTLALWDQFSPVPQIVLLALTLYFVFKILSRFINFSISFKSKQ